MEKSTLEQMNDLKEEALKNEKNKIDRETDSENFISDEDEIDSTEKEENRKVINIPDRNVTNRDHGRTLRSHIDDNDPGTINSI